jgi:hypothetical protein
MVGYLLLSQLLPLLVADRTCFCRSVLFTRSLFVLITKITRLRQRLLLFDVSMQLLLTPKYSWPEWSRFEGLHYFDGYVTYVKGITVLLIGSFQEL